MMKISRVNSEKKGFGSAGARKRWLVFVNGTAVDLTGIIKNAHYFWRDAICFPVVHFSALEDYSDKRSDLKLEYDSREDDLLQTWKETWNVRKWNSSKIGSF